MSFAPALVVDPIGRQPVKYGLLSVLKPVEPGDTNPHWENGLTWESLGCAAASGLGESVCPPAQQFGLPFHMDRGVPIDNAHPFNIYHSFVCSPVGHGDPFTYAKERAEALLMAREIQRVEQAMWTGDLYDAANSIGAPGFASAATVLGNSATTPVALRHGIGLLEDYISSTYGSLGILHMSRLTANEGCADFSLDTFPNGQLMTQLETPVIAGQGYHGLAPDGSDPGVGFAWLYATPMMEMWRSDVLSVVPQAPGLTQKNDLEAIAQRTYVVRYDGEGELGSTSCPVGAVKVNLDIFA